ncbi:hypothetical protein ACWEOE_10805 [Amycolatopsis sp. NPDC004368]
MNQPRSCVLGCRDRDGVPFRAAPGLLVCPACSEKLRGVLDDLERTFYALDDVDELTPHGSPDGAGVRQVAGSRSPAVDALLVHRDPRSVTGVHESPAALASMAEFARTVREDRSIDVPREQLRATVPAGRITMRRECATLRFNWDWIMAQPWVDDFAAELRRVLDALRSVRREFAPALRIGKCPTALIGLDLPDGDAVTLDCGATLKVRAGDTEVRCRNCGTTWPRDRWHELGDPWTDYASLSADLGVPVGTLRRWAHEDSWQRTNRPGRPLIARADALASLARRRPNATLEQAG